MNMGIERSVELCAKCISRFGPAALEIKIYLCYKGFMECLNFKLIL